MAIFLSSFLQVLDVWFGRTVIRSCAKLSYEDALTVLETPNDYLDKLRSRIHVNEPFTLANIKRSVTYLDMVSDKSNLQKLYCTFCKHLFQFYMALFYSCNSLRFIFDNRLITHFLLGFFILILLFLQLASPKDAKTADRQRCVVAG